MVLSVEELRWDFYKKEREAEEDATRVWELGKALGLIGNEKEMEIHKKLIAMEKRDRKIERKNKQDGKEMNERLIQCPKL